MLTTKTGDTHVVTISNFFDPVAEIEQTNRRRRRKKKNKRIETSSRELLPINFQIQKIVPKTYSQELTFKEFHKGKNLLLIGTAGTGKSFLSFYLSLSEILYSRTYEKLVILRSTVPSRDIGFLPGDKNKKTEVYEAPYQMICQELFGKSSSYDNLKRHGIIEFDITSFLRGQTFNDCIIIVDEVQNMTYQELTTILTRVGKNVKIILSGDLKQNDLQNSKKETSGLQDIINILKTMESISTVEFNVEDIVRSDFVKEFIIAEEKYNANNKPKVEVQISQR